MKVIIFGATGMVGRGVLLECLDDERVERVLIVTRTPMNVKHGKVHELVPQSFFDFSAAQSEFAGYDACFFCLGVSSVGMSEREYDHLTYDLTLAAATAIASVTARRLTFCYVSGEGTDSTNPAAWSAFVNSVPPIPRRGHTSRVVCPGCDPDRLMDWIATHSTTS